MKKELRISEDHMTRYLTDNQLVVISQDQALEALQYGDVYTSEVDGILTFAVSQANKVGKTDG